MDITPANEEETFLVHTENQDQDMFIDSAAGDSPTLALTPSEIEWQILCQEFKQICPTYKSQNLGRISAITILQHALMKDGGSQRSFLSHRDYQGIEVSDNCEILSFTGH